MNPAPFACLLTYITFLMSKSALKKQKKSQYITMNDPFSPDCIIEGLSHSTVDSKNFGRQTIKAKTFKGTT